MRTNKLRVLLRKGEPTLGTRVLIPWSGLVEIIGRTQLYDYFEFVSEYAPYDLHDLDNLARASEIVDISSMIKIDYSSRSYLAGRALAAGIQNILFVDTRTVQDAEEAERAVRAEPKGMSGYRMDRRCGYVGVTATGADVVKMCDEVVVALMIEKKPAVENLEDILSVEGIDMVQFGPMDYSLSIGLPGEVGHPKVKEAEIRTIKTALKLDVAPRAEVRNLEEARKYLDLGVRNFSLNTDVKILFDWLRENGNKMRETISKI